MAIVLSLAFALLAGAAGYWGVAMAPDLVTVAGRRGGHRGRPDRDARAHQGPDRQGPRQQQEGRQRRVVPGLHRARGQPGRRLRLVALRTGRARALLRRRADRAVGRSVDRRLRQVRGRPLRPAGPDPVAVVRPAAGRRDRARPAARRDRDARSADRRGPRARLDADLRRLGHRGPGDRQGHLRGAPGRPGPAAPAARHARALRAGLGVQDRDRGGRPRVPGDHAGDDVQAAAGRREERPPRRRLSASATAITRRPARRRSTSSARPRCRATSATR